ncbi:hypothetical protein EYF80_007990 [Liparis tanakae]|uniref:Uncharacterized protein n=1 Tax=Liparis tanakae TaxID=230148 RepID=A0A4Z2IVL0_9TELE|nr:hypothetical protein EYF80_007990 [Liparis tanakae]
MLALHMGRVPQWRPVQHGGVCFCRREMFCFRAFPEYLQIFPEGTLQCDVAPPVFKAQSFPGAPQQIIFLVSPADNCEVRTHLDAYELLTVICGEIVDTVASHVPFCPLFFPRLCPISPRNREPGWLAGRWDRRGWQGLANP